MAKITSIINGVNIQLANTVVNDVDQKMIDGLNYCIKKLISPNYELSDIYISSAYDSHELPSRHMQHKAVDISRINGTKISIGYQQGGSVKGIVNAIQDTFENYSHRRENFGPHLKKKLGQNYAASGHSDHIHLSVE